LPRPIRFNQRETVEIAIRRTSAISAAVIRSLRRDPIASIVCFGVLEGTLLGAEGRSLIGSPAR